MYILIYGTPTEGFRHVGPFVSREAAQLYLRDEMSSSNIFIAELDEPAPVEQLRTDREKWSK